MHVCVKPWQFVHQNHMWKFKSQEPVSNWSLLSMDLDFHHFKTGWFGHLEISGKIIEQWPYLNNRCHRFASISVDSIKKPKDFVSAKARIRSDIAIFKGLSRLFEMLYLLQVANPPFFPSCWHSGCSKVSSKESCQQQTGRIPKFYQIFPTK